MKNWIVAIKYLFRDFILYNLLFTCIGSYMLTVYGNSSYTHIFWLKVAGYILTAISYYWYNKKHLYFYHNLGLNKRNLGVIVVSIDGALTLVILILIKTIFST